MALVPSLSKPLMNSRGALGMLFELGTHAFGGGAVVNVFDKEVLGGKMTATGVNLPFTLPGTTAPVRLALNDLAFVAMVNGLKVPKGKGLFLLLAKLGLKKIAESKQWIDPYEVPAAAPSPGPAQEPMPMIQTGGLTGR